MTNTPKTAESSVAQASDNAAENTTEEATGRRVRILSARSAGRYPDAVGGTHHRH